MKVIQVGAITIVSHDNYWKCLLEIKKYEDMISRGLGTKEGESDLDTPFAKSTLDLKQHSSMEYLNQLKEACNIFEETYPKNPKIFGEIELKLIKEC